MRGAQPPAWDRERQACAAARTAHNLECATNASRPAAHAREAVSIRCRSRIEALAIVTDAQDQSMMIQVHGDLDLCDWPNGARHCAGFP